MSNKYASAISRLQNKFPFIGDVSVFDQVITDELRVSKIFGPYQKGFARMSILTDQAFEMLFPGAELECFSSPLSSHLSNYCSLSHGHGLLGSKGDIMKYNIVETNIAVHPPNDDRAVKAFFNKLSAQRRYQHITMRMFIPDWENVELLFGEFAQYVTNTKHYSRETITANKMMMNGNPAHFGQFWTPLKDRILVTFVIPPNYSVEPAIFNELCVLSSIEEEVDEIVHNINTLDATHDEVFTSPARASQLSLPKYIETIIERSPESPADNIRLAIHMLTGISDPVMKSKGDTLYNKLMLEYTGFDYPIMEVDDSNKSHTRANLRIYVQQFLPHMSYFLSMSETCQSDTLRQAISIVVAYSHVIESSQLLSVLTLLYDEWLEGRISNDDIFSLYPLWIEFESRVLDSFLSDVCPNLTVINQTDFHTQCLNQCPLTSLVTPECHITGITYVNPLSILVSDCNGESLSDILVGKLRLDKIKDKVDGIFYTANVMSDLTAIDDMIEFHTATFSSLVVVTHDFEAVANITGRHHDYVVDSASFNGKDAYYIFLVSRYVTFSNDQSLAKLNEVVSCTDLALCYKYLSASDVHMLHVVQSVFKDKWLWFKNDFSAIMNPIIMYLSLAFNERLVNSRSLRGARALHWAIMSIHENSALLFTKAAFAIEHPLVVHCGGEGVDLYLNKLDHSISTLMFMHEKFAFPISFPKYLRMNMLDRKWADLALLKVVMKYTLNVDGVADVRRFDQAQNTTFGAFAMERDSVGLSTVSNYSQTSFVAAYKWTYFKRQFFSPCRLLSALKIENVFFFQAYNVRTKMYVVIQVLHVSDDDVNRPDWHTGHFLHFYLPHDSTAKYSHEMIRRVIDPYLLDGSVSQICTILFQILTTVDLDDHKPNYFPNLHIERHVSNNDFGVNLENYYPIFDSDAGLVELREYMEFLQEYRDVRAGPDYSDHEVAGCTRQESLEWTEKYFAALNFQTPFGRTSRVLNDHLRNCSIQGWVPSVVNAVPMYYFDVLRNLSRGQYTQMGAPINYHTSRVEHDGMTTFPCPGSNYVWNSRIGQLLSAACVKVSTVNKNTWDRAILDSNEWYTPTRHLDHRSHIFEAIIPKYKIERTGYTMLSDYFSQHIDRSHGIRSVNLAPPSPNYDEDPGHVTNQEADDDDRLWRDRFGDND